MQFDKYSLEKKKKKKTVPIHTFFSFLQKLRTVFM